MEILRIPSKLLPGTITGRERRKNRRKKKMIKMEKIRNRKPKNKRKKVSVRSTK
jgi:hypothetical protein